MSRGIPPMGDTGAARGRLLHRDAGVALTSGGPVAVIDGLLDAGVYPEPLVTGLGSDTGCLVALDAGAL